MNNQDKKTPAEITAGIKGGSTRMNQENKTAEQFLLGSSNSNLKSILANYPLTNEVIKAMEEYAQLQVTQKLEQKDKEIEELKQELEDSEMVVTAFQLSLEEAKKQELMLCPKCNGEGWVLAQGTTTSPYRDCPACNGSKFVQKFANVSVSTEKEWISCKDRLPEENGLYLTYEKEDPRRSVQWLIQVRFWNTGNGFAHANVLYWQPCPDTSNLK